MNLNQFYLNKNKYKTAENQPSYVAQIKNEDGTYSKIASAWVSKDKDGNPSISVKFAEGLFLEGTPSYRPKPKVSQGEATDIPFD